MRIGNFSSSSISKLMTYGKDGKSFGKPALTYIAEKNMERMLGRSLNSEHSARPTTWGTLVEERVFELLPLEYQLVSRERLVHPDCDSWVGMPDCVNETEVCDIKSPYTLKSFCELVDACNKGIEGFKEHSPEYYWQLISNAILTNRKYITLIVYVPYKSELDAIRELANNYLGDANKMAWIGFANDEDLPYLIEGKHYKNLNIFKFEVNEADKQELTERVLTASKLLIQC